MPKLTFVKNPLTEEKYEFFSKDESLKNLIANFKKVNDGFSFEENIGYSVVIDGKKLTEVVEDVELKEEYEVVIIQDINEPATLTAMLTAMSASFTSAATGTAVAGATGVAAGTAAAGAGIAAGTSLTIGGLVTGAAYVGAGLGYAVGAVGIGGIISAVGAAASLFGSHKPPSMSGGGEGSPGENSPKYGWNVRQSQSDGIPIPVIYGKEKVGGNIISKSTESLPTFAWDWFNNQDEGCQFMVLPVAPTPIPVPFINAGIVGAWPWVRGVACEVDTNVWIYTFVTLELWTVADIKNFFAALNAKGKQFIKTKEDFKNFLNFLGCVVDRARRRTFWNTTISNFVENTLTGSFSKSRATSNEFGDDIINLLGKCKFGAAIDSDFTKKDQETYGISDDFKNEIKTWLSDVFYKKSKDNSTNTDGSKGGFKLKIKNHVPILHGDTFFQIYDDNASEIDNLGTYFVFCIAWFPDAIEPQWWIKNVHGLTKKAEVEKMKFELFDLSFKDNQISYQNYLHELIGIGEGECENLETLFLNNLPIQTFPGVNYFFMPGSNDDTFVLTKASSFTEMAKYDKTVVSHSDGGELVDAGDYIDFETTPEFLANNVYVRLKFNAYRMTLKAKIDDLDDTPIRFLILVGLDGITEDFGSFDLNDITNSPFNLRCLCWPISVYGGMKDPFYRMYPVLPFPDVLKKLGDLALNLIPGGLRATAFFLGITTLEDGSEINWLRVITDTAYRSRVATFVRETLNELYNNNTRKIKVRILRATSHVDNQRYTDTMTVEGFDEVSYLSYDYPNLCKIGIGIRATEKLNTSEPKVTAIIKGKKIWVPQLQFNYKGKTYYPSFEKCWFDEDIGKYRNRDSRPRDASTLIRVENMETCFGAPCEYAYKSTDTSTYKNLKWSYEYSNNNAWCLYDILTQKRYGLGNYIEPNDLPLDWFIAAAQHCDEMVPDGRQRWVTTNADIESPSESYHVILDQDSDLFEKKKVFWDDDLGQFNPYPPDDSTIGNSTESEPVDFQMYRDVEDYNGIALFVETPESYASGETNATYTKTFVHYCEKVYNGVTRVVKFHVGGNKDQISYRYPATAGYDGDGEIRVRYTNGNPAYEPEDGTPSTRYMIGRKRYTLNYVMDDSCSATDVIKQLCQTFRCYTIWTNGGIIPLIDKPEASRVVIGMGNIIKDSMSIAYKSISDVPNILECQFSNEELWYEKDTRQVADTDTDTMFPLDISKIPRKKQVKILGVTDPAVILCELRYRLQSEKNQTEVIQFTAGIDQINLMAGQVFTFAHDVIQGVGKSGRIIDFISSESDGDWILLDEPLPSEYIEETLQIKVSFINSDIEEQTYSFSVVDIDEDNYAKIKVNFGDFDPQNDLYNIKFKPYVIGITGTISKDYRAVTVVPTENYEVQITAIEYDEDVYGTIRETKLGEYSYYDPTPLTAKNNRTTLVNATEVYKPIPSASLSVTRDRNTGDGRLRLVLAWDVPRRNNVILPQYRGCLITRTIGNGKPEDVILASKTSMSYPDDSKSIIATALITYTFYAKYETLTGDEIFTSPVEIQVIPNEIEGFEGDPTPDKVTGIVLEKWSQKNFGLIKKNIEPYPNVFVTRNFGIKWDAVGITQPETVAAFLEPVTIEHYIVEVNTYLSGKSIPNNYQITTGALIRRCTIGYEEMGLSNYSELKNVQRVEVSIAAQASNSVIGEYETATFTPDSADGVVGVHYMSVGTGLIIWWQKADPSMDIEQYQVDVTLTNKSTSISYPEHSNLRAIVKSEVCYIPITKENRAALGTYLFTGIRSEVTATITPLTAWGNTTDSGTGGGVIDAYTEVGVPALIDSSSIEADLVPIAVGWFKKVTWRLAINWQWSTDTANDGNPEDDGEFIIEYKRTSDSVWKREKIDFGTDTSPNHLVNLLFTPSNTSHPSGGYIPNDNSNVRVRIASLAKGVQSDWYPSSEGHIVTFASSEDLGDPPSPECSWDLNDGGWLTRDITINCCEQDYVFPANFSKFSVHARIGTGDNWEPDTKTYKDCILGNISAETASAPVICLVPRFLFLGSDETLSFGGKVWLPSWNLENDTANGGLEIKVVPHVYELSGDTNSYIPVAKNTKKSSGTNTENSNYQEGFDWFNSSIIPLGSIGAVAGDVMYSPAASLSRPAFSSATRFYIQNNNQSSVAAFAVGDILVVLDGYGQQMGSATKEYVRVTAVNSSLTSLLNYIDVARDFGNRLATHPSYKANATVFKCGEYPLSNYGFIWIDSEDDAMKIMCSTTSDEHNDGFTVDPFNDSAVKGKFGDPSGDGVELIAAQIATQASLLADSSSGAGVLINSSGIYGYNSSHAEMFKINASTGAATFSGGTPGSDWPHTIDGNFAVTGQLKIGSSTGFYITGSTGKITSISSGIDIDGVNKKITVGATLNSQIILDSTNKQILIGYTGNNQGIVIDATAGQEKITLGNNAIVLDAYNEKITVGQTSGTHIIIDGGSTEVIKSSNFSIPDAGAGLGSGFGIYTGDAYFGNIHCRGAFECSVFKTKTTSAIAGSMMVCERAAESLAYVGGLITDTTMYFESGAFSVGDYIFAKKWHAPTSSIVIEGMLITAVNVDSEPTKYTVERFKYVSPTGGYGWDKGTTFLKYADSGTVSNILLSAGDGTLGFSSYGPTITLNERTGSGTSNPFTGGTVKTAIGDLSAIGTTAKFGALSGYGIYTNNGYFSGNLFLDAGNDLYLYPSIANAAIIRWATEYGGTAIGTIYCTNDTFIINYNGTSGVDYIQGNSDGLKLNYIGESDASHYLYLNADEAELVSGNDILLTASGQIKLYTDDGLGIILWANAVNANIYNGKHQLYFDYSGDQGSFRKYNYPSFGFIINSTSVYMGCTANYNFSLASSGNSVLKVNGNSFTFTTTGIFQPAVGYNSADGSAGITATCTLAKISSGGTNGSLTLKNGIVTAYLIPT